ncbi:hypothetical protein OG885_08765 [Streptomyces sp. NBC_00028]|uniref:hypothetical protein n=1 Tax=Streptomyces sp. NBC_00028 TaxID=2975624 RepID=UPI00324B9277
MLADPRFSADATRKGFPGLSPFAPPRGPGQFFVMDPPDHTRLRRTLIPDFTFRRIERLRPAIAAVCADLLDTMTADGATEADLVAAYALPQPTRVICALLGVPYDDHAFLHQTGARPHRLRLRPPGPDDGRTPGPVRLPR